MAKSHYVWKYYKVPFFSFAYFFNLFLDKVFTFHNHPTGGEVVGLNPTFIKKYNIKFDDNLSLKQYKIDDKYFEKTFEMSNLKLDYKYKNILFIGDYSIENGVNDFVNFTFID